MRSKAIYVNGRFLTQPVSGVNRFAYELTRALISLGTDIVVVCPNREINKEYDLTGFHIVKFGIGNSHIWEQLSLPFFFLFKRNFVLLIFTGLGPVCMSNKIMTIHDLAFMENPNWYSKTYVLWYKMLTPVCSKTSKRVLTVSNFSKREIIRKLRIKEDHITVIYNAASLCDEVQQISPNGIPDKFFLAVSSIDPRKNFERLIRVFSDIPEYNLVVVGGGNHVFARVNIPTSHENIVFTGHVSDGELISLYKNAMAFIYPSLYEGFGIPPIEAMSFGCPVMVSDIEVLHEVCGDAAVFFNPTDDNEIRDRILLLAHTPLLCNELRDRGYENIKRFSWNNSARRLKEIID